jgi:hypothetical protein
VGWDWIVITMIAWIAAFTKTRLQKTIVLVCGGAMLVETAIMVGFLGWFIGSEMVLAAGTFLLAGGLLFPSEPL